MPAPKITTRPFSRCRIARRGSGDHEVMWSGGDADGAGAIGLRALADEGWKKAGIPLATQEQHVVGLHGAHQAQVVGERPHRPEELGEAEAALA